jgi:hypothetical protein
MVDHFLLDIAVEPGIAARVASGNPARSEVEAATWRATGVHRQ